MFEPSESNFQIAEGARPAAILVVDDSAINRTKMRLAVRNLGHEADVAENGQAALNALRAKSYDAVLLDIMMPVMDGFDVLREIKTDPALRDIPVIVVSALDDETESVVRAIELGAEDFLPKNFDPVLLNARLGASLTKKRFRDQEKEYFARVNKLTEAAEILESGAFTPQSLALDDLASRNDPLGHLAAVFRGMAAEIYDRELRLKRAVHMLQGSLLVIAVGATWGLTPSLARMASGIGSNPLGLAVWVNTISGLFCLGIAAYRKKLPRLKWREIRFFLIWAVIAGVMQRLTTFWVTEHVEAAVLSLIVTLQGFMVFGYAAASGLEKANPRRLLGLFVGLVGVAAVLYSRFDLKSSTDGLWIGVSMLLPLLFAIEAIFLASKRPKEIDIFASVGIMMSMSAFMLIPLTLWQGDFMPLRVHFGKIELLIILMGVVGSTSLLLAFRLITTAGAVFASQSAYAMTVAGIIWGMLLLDEQLSALAWVAFALICVGLYLVEPAGGDDRVILNRSFSRKRSA